MRIDVRDIETLRRLGRAEVDPEQRPSKARLDRGGREVFLDWEAAVDDAGRLRRCVVCGCRDLYVARVFPQITGFVIVLAFAGAALGITGVADRYPVLYIVLVAVLILDIASLVFSRKRLVCYRCRSTYAGVEIARHYSQWDRAVAERYRRNRAEARSGRDLAGALPASAEPTEVEFIE